VEQVKIPPSVTFYSLDQS